jgi:4-carboxymuconolactone decarboxylase
MARIPIFNEQSDFNPVQRRVVDGILGRRGGRIPGPYRLSLHAPEVTEVWHPLGEKLRLNSCFPLRLSEFAIIVTARCLDCDYVFNAHAKIAVEAGLSQSIADAMVKNQRPAFAADKNGAEEEAIYDYGTELFRKHAISDKSYDRAKAIFGIPAIVELSCLMGYYGMVAMTLLSHQMPLQEGAVILQGKVSG